MKNLEQQNCESCPAYNPGILKRLGIEMDQYDHLIALAGNPNTGKSTVFNALTGLRQHTGNWPGKTVTRAEGGFKYNDKKYKIVDLPGTYSLLSTSTDEEVARDFILFGQPDVTVVVVDSTRLERNLNLTLQILEITDRVVVCLNLIDESERNGIILNDRQLSKELGVPVVAAAARRGEGIKNLLKNIEDVITGEFKCKPRRIDSFPSSFSNALKELQAQIEDEYPGIPNARWIALRLLEGDQKIIDSVKSGEISLLIKNNGRTKNNFAVNEK